MDSKVALANEIKVIAKEMIRALEDGAQHVVGHVKSEDLYAGSDIQIHTVCFRFENGDSVSLTVTRRVSK